jgi:hypothetical protein
MMELPHILNNPCRRAMEPGHGHFQFDPPQIGHGHHACEQVAADFAVRPMAYRAGVGIILAEPEPASLSARRITWSTMALRSIS